MSVANQKIIKIKKELCDKKHKYSLINLEALETALTDLDGDRFKLWVYFSKNQNEYQMELSQKAVSEQTGISRASYYRYIAEFENKGYLVPVKEDSNIYYFYEIPQSHSETKLSQKDTTESHNETKLSHRETTQSHGDKRNITNNTNITTNNTDNILSSQREEELEQLVGSDSSYKDTWLDKGCESFYTWSRKDKINHIIKNFPEFSTSDAIYIVNNIID